MIGVVAKVQISCPSTLIWVANRIIAQHEHYADEKGDDRRKADGKDEWKEERMTLPAEAEHERIFKEFKQIGGEIAPARSAFREIERREQLDDRRDQHHAQLHAGILANLHLLQGVYGRDGDHVMEE